MSAGDRRRKTGGIPRVVMNARDTVRFVASGGVSRPLPGGILIIFRETTEKVRGFWLADLTGAGVCPPEYRFLRKWGNAEGIGVGLR